MTYADAQSAPGPQTPTQTSGLAIAALVFGILAIIPGLGLLAALVGFILSLVAMASIRKSRGQVGGNVLAVIGLVLSCVFGLFNLLILAAVLIPSLVGARDAALQVKAMNDLKQLYMSINMYQVDQGEFPPDLQALYDAGLIEAEQLRNPRNDAPPPAPGNIDAQSDYIYVQGVNLSHGSQAIVAFARPRKNADEVPVVFVDGSVASLPKAEFRDQLEAQSREHDIPIPVYEPASY
jgi:type II secretory pathway pseudopilin PulG